VPEVISSIRNEYFGPRYRELLLRATERLSLVTVVNSQRVADSLVERRIASPGHLIVIHNGVNVSQFRASPEYRKTARGSLSVAEDEFVWLTVGRLAEQKGYPNLFRAFSRVIETPSRARLFVVGRGPLDDDLRDLVRRLDLEANITFLGFRDDVPALLGASDAFVLASRWEGMPNAVMEACASGLPVVGTAVGGMDELIQEGKNGYLVPPGEPDALAKAMIDLMGVRPERRREMGLRGQDLMRQQFECKVVMDKWSQFISHVAPSGLGR
jgi:glycosyltransferase involved in cell wall biosynthesis